jgi:8-oxo-dGTP pyrophosphatase MutT (NUDIX family)
MSQKQHPPRLREAFGGLVFDERGHVLLREPAGHFDGYVWTFPKGRPEPGESGEEAALREVREETGVVARIVRPVPGDFAGGTTSNRYYLMEPVDLGGEPDPAETSAVCWVDPDQARVLLARTTNSTGLRRDLAVLEAALEARKG